MKTLDNFKGIRWGVIWLFVGVATAGCGRLSEEEQAFLDEKQRQAEMMENFGKRLSEGEEQNKAIATVQEFKLDSGSTVAQWVKSRMVELDGNLVTSRWTARRKGENSTEVRYHYTVLVKNDVPERRGYAWIYDELVEQVIGPRELDRSQASAITNQRIVGQQFSRHRRHSEDTLE